MVYSAEISRDNPTAILFVIDQSGSMDERMVTGKTKAAFVADVLNKTLYTIATTCRKADEVRHYFDIGVVGYGGAGVSIGLGGGHIAGVFKSITELEAAPLRVEDRTRLEDDGTGGVLERKSKFPVWFDPASSGGTPMSAALTEAARALVDWCDKHPHSYPPTVVHVTDGASTDGDPSTVASAIRQISTGDGECLLFNIHVSAEAGEKVQFPNSEASLFDNYGRLLFRMSSVLPDHVAKLAADKGYHITEGGRGFMFNADPKDITDFFDIGTRPRLTADR